MGTTFDITALQQPVTGKMATGRPPIPPGEYQAVIVSEPPWQLREPRQPSGVPYAIEGKGDNAGKTWYIVDYYMQINEPGNDAANDRIIAYSCFLDVTEDGHLMASGDKNESLGKLRKAVGQNTDDAWSPTDPVGSSCVIRVAEVPDRRDPNRTNTEVTRVGPLM